MSTWTEDKATIESVFNDYGYKKLEFNLNQDDEAPATYEHKSYTFKPIGNQINPLVNNKHLGSTEMELKVSYTNIDDNTYDSNYGLWITILNAIAQYVKGFVSQSFLTDINDNNYSHGTANFYIGENQC